ncbi:hypothetical protein PR202_ga27873 [Eleusine coracana subsp. coracana]|uniref:Uncharacterized protein n=1 Tax=Eleusine coracana subsp. coracana TaxID=191504 RepID=A0AAV5DH32_ELECO|nr:hypothetical protein PR202_ga27873 [Eleusine coracana subsp. coracana]
MVSACSFLAYLSVPKLFELGELPFPAGGHLDEPVRGVLGIGSFLRRRRPHTASARRVHRATAATHEHSSTTRPPPCRGRRSNTSRRRQRAAPCHVPCAGGGVQPVARGRRMPSMARRPGGPVRCVYVSLSSLAVVSQDQFTDFPVRSRRRRAPFALGAPAGHVRREPGHRVQRSHRRGWKGQGTCRAVGAAARRAAAPGGGVLTDASRHSTRSWRATITTPARRSLPSHNSTAHATL